MYGMKDVKGWQTIRCPLWFAICLEGAGYAKAQQAGNAPDTFQLRLTGDGKRWLRTYTSLT